MEEVGARGVRGAAPPAGRAAEQRLQCASRRGPGAGAAGMWPPRDVCAALLATASAGHVTPLSANLPSPERCSYDRQTARLYMLVWLWEWVRCLCVGVFRGPFAAGPSPLSCGGTPATLTTYHTSTAGHGAAEIGF